MILDIEQRHLLSKSMSSIKERHFPMKLNEKVFERHRLESNPVAFRHRGRRRAPMVAGLAMGVLERVRCSLPCGRPFVFKAARVFFSPLFPERRAESFASVSFRCPRLPMTNRAPAFRSTGRVVLFLLVQVLLFLFILSFAIQLAHLFSQLANQRIGALPKFYKVQFTSSTSISRFDSLEMTQFV